MRSILRLAIAFAALLSPSSSRAQVGSITWQSNGSRVCNAAVANVLGTVTCANGVATFTTGDGGLLLTAGDNIVLDPTTITTTGTISTSLTPSFTTVTSTSYLPAVANTNHIGTSTLAFYDLWVNHIQFPQSGDITAGDGELDQSAGGVTISGGLGGAADVSSGGTGGLVDVVGGVGGSANTVGGAGPGGAVRLVGGRGGASVAMGAFDAAAGGSASLIGGTGGPAPNNTAIPGSGGNVVIVGGGGGTGAIAATGGSVVIMPGGGTNGGGPGAIALGDPGLPTGFTVAYASIYPGVTASLGLSDGHEWSGVYASLFSSTVGSVALFSGQADTDIVPFVLTAGSDYANKYVLEVKDQNGSNSVFAVSPGSASVFIGRKDSTIIGIGDDSRIIAINAAHTGGGDFSTIMDGTGTVGQSNHKFASMDSLLYFTAEQTPGTSTTPTWDCSSGSIITATVTAGTSPVMANAASPTLTCKLLIKESGGGSPFTITWPGNVSAPAATATDGHYDMFDCVWSFSASKWACGLLRGNFTL